MGEPRKEILSSQLGSELLNAEVYFIKNKKRKEKKLTKCDYRVSETAHDWPACER